MRLVNVISNLPAQKEDNDMEVIPFSISPLLNGPCVPDLVLENWMTIRHGLQQGIKVRVNVIYRDESLALVPISEI